MSPGQAGGTEAGESGCKSRLLVGRVVGPARRVGACHYTIHLLLLAE